MNKLGSEFLKEFQEYKRSGLFGLTKKTFLMYLGLIIGTGISVMMYVFKLPEILQYTVAAIIIVPVIFYGRGQSEEVKERWKFRYTIQDRSYQTELGEEKKYTKYDFIQSKKVSESDSF